MKPIPPPAIPGKTEWQRFDNAIRKIINMPKRAMVKPASKPKPTPK